MTIFKMCLVAHVLNKRKKVVPIILHHSDLTNKKIFISFLVLRNLQFRQKIICSIVYRRFKCIIFFYHLII